jgi:hypothetical protein
MAFLNAGKRIDDYLKENPNVNFNGLFNQLAIGIGRVHAANCSWNDLAVRNILVSDKQNNPEITLIDFDLDFAKKLSNVNWNNFLDLSTYFSKDIGSLKIVLHYLIKNPELRLKYIKYVISRILYQYPCSEQIKRELFDIWTKDL